MLVYSQPIVVLPRGTTEREELLVRISDGDGGVELPAGFLYAAEASGLMPEIDRRVTERAAELAAAGRAVHVNLSNATVADPDFVFHVVETVREYGADPSLITFELRETPPAGDVSAAAQLGERLVELGFTLAIDDFGSGVAAFRCLRHLPVAYLKIDREFTHDVCMSPRAQRLILGIVAMARMFGVETIAEGVEDGPTLTLLSGMGVDYAQGFHIARPEPV